MYGENPISMEKTQFSFGSGRFFQYLATAASALYTLTCGLDYGWSSPSLVKLTSEVHLTSNEGSWLTVSSIFGNLIGSLCSGVILNRVGRKTTSQITATLFVFAWFVLAFARSFPTLVVARVLTGIPDTMVYCTLPLYLGEVSDPKIRGALFCCTTLAEGFGYLLMNNIGTYLSIRTAALTATAFPIMSFVIFWFLPESPYYLIANGRFEQAKRSLKVFQGSVNVDEQFNRIRKAVEDERIANTGRYLDLFKVPSNRKAFLIVCGMRTIMQMSGYMAINFYAQTIFKNVQSSVPASAWSSIYFALQMIFAGINALLVDRAGRKPLMIIATLGNFVTLSVLSVAFYLNSKGIISSNVFTISSVVSLIGFVILFNLGLPSATMLLLGEMFPTNVKCYATSTHEMYFCFITILATKMFYLTKENFGMHVPFAVFAISSILGLFFVIFFVPETKQKSLEEVQDMLKDKNVEKKNVELELIN